MLRRPHLLVLDEATSAIDVEREQAILERLLRVTPRSTIVTIATAWKVYAIVKSQTLRMKLS
jgi:ABC-type multidrug transport system fused ATPase/permease subunit